MRIQVHYRAVHPANIKTRLQARFAGANICVIKIQLPVVPCLRESKRWTNSPTNSLKRRRHFHIFTTISVKREATFCHSLSFWWLPHIFDSSMSTFCWLLAWIASEKQKWENESCFSMNWEIPVRSEDINDKFLLEKLECNCSARATFWSYVIASYLGSNRSFRIFNSKWSYDKMLIDWVMSGRTGKYLALGQEVRTSLRSVRTPWPRAKYFPVRPSHSVNKYIVRSP